LLTDARRQADPEQNDGAAHGKDGQQVADSPATPIQAERFTLCSRLTMVLTAMTWSGSVAWRIPSKKAGRHHTSPDAAQHHAGKEPLRVAHRPRTGQ